MRTSYFRDIAESMARNAKLERMSNGNYASPNRSYGNTYYSDMARYFQESGQPSMEVARRPSQEEFMQIILPTLPAAWGQMSPADAWNAFQQMPINNQVGLAEQAGIKWRDMTQVGGGFTGEGNTPAAQPNMPGMETYRMPAEDIYDSMVRIGDLPLRPDGTFITKEEWYNMPIENQASWVQEAGRRSMERAASKTQYGTPFQTIVQGTTSGYNREVPPVGTPPSTLPPSSTPPKKPVGKVGTKKRKKSTRKAGDNIPGRDKAGTYVPGYEEQFRGIPAQDLYKDVPKRVLGGPNSILDFFGNARAYGRMTPYSKGQNGQLLYSGDLDKAGLGDFFKGVGRTVHDYGRGMADSFGNMTGLYDLSNEKYKTKFGQKYAGKADKFSRGIGSIGRMAADVFLPGAGTALGMAGQALNPNGLGNKQQQRDMQKASMAGSMALGLGVPSMGGDQTQGYQPSGQEAFMSAIAPGLAGLLPSLLGGSLSPGGIAGGRNTAGMNIGDPGVYSQGGMPNALVRHMEFMGLFSPNPHNQNTRPYLVY